MEELINQAFLVGQEIKNTEDYKRLIELKKIIDSKYSKEINAFKEHTEEYNKLILSNDKYSSKFKESSSNLIDSKVSLYVKEEVVEYFKIERIIQEELNKFSKEIAKAVSKNISVPNDFGIVNTEKKHGK